MRPRSPQRYIDALGNPSADDKAQQELVYFSPEDLSAILEAKLIQEQEQKKIVGCTLNFEGKIFHRDNNQVAQKFVDVILKYQGVDCINFTDTYIHSTTIIKIINQLAQLENPPILKWRPDNDVITGSPDTHHKPNLDACDIMITALNEIRAIHNLDQNKYPLEIKILMKDICRKIILLQTEQINSSFGRETKQNQIDALKELYHDILLVLSGFIVKNPLPQVDLILKKFTGQFSSFFTKKDYASELLVRAQALLGAKEFFQQILKNCLITSCDQYWNEQKWGNLRFASFANKNNNYISNDKRSEAKQSNTPILMREGEQLEHFLIYGDKMGNGQWEYTRIEDKAAILKNLNLPDEGAILKRNDPVFSEVLSGILKAGHNRQQPDKYGRYFNNVEHSLALCIANLPNSDEQKAESADLFEMDSFQQNSMYCLQLGALNPRDSKRRNMWFDVAINLPYIFRHAIDCMNDIEKYPFLARPIREFLRFAIKEKANYPWMSEDQLNEIESVLANQVVLPENSKFPSRVLISEGPYREVFSEIVLEEKKFEPGVAVQESNAATAKAMQDKQRQHDENLFAEEKKMEGESEKERFERIKHMKLLNRENKILEGKTPLQIDLYHIFNRAATDFQFSRKKSDKDKVEDKAEDKVDFIWSVFNAIKTAILKTSDREELKKIIDVIYDKATKEDKYSAEGMAFLKQSIEHATLAFKYDLEKQTRHIDANTTVSIHIPQSPRLFGKSIGTTDSDFSLNNTIVALQKHFDVLEQIKRSKVKSEYSSTDIRIMHCLHGALNQLLNVKLEENTLSAIKHEIDGIKPDKSPISENIQKQKDDIQSFVDNILKNLSESKITFEQIENAIQHRPRGFQIGR